MRPSFTRSYHQGRTSLWLLAMLAGAAAIWGGAIIGLWAAPFIVGVAAGLANWYGGFRARIMIFAVVFMAVVGWGIALAWPALHHQPVWVTSRTIAALLGLPGARAGRDQPHAAHRGGPGGDRAVAGPGVVTAAGLASVARLTGKHRVHAGVQVAAS